MQDIITYIIRFLLGDHLPSDIISYIGYTADKSEYGKYKIVIEPSTFFASEIYGTPASLPSEPLEQIAGIPLLFGKPEIHYERDTLVTTADIIASTYFLITRYEEIINRKERDEHGRFCGKQSLPGRAGFIHRPIVDEYGRLLRKWLKAQGVNIPPEPYGIKKVYLTHDVDAPFYCRTLRAVVRETIKRRAPLFALKNILGKVDKDPYYTFPWLMKKDDEVRQKLGAKRCEIICFFKSGGQGKYDKPLYNIKSVDIQTLLSLCRANKVTIGLHSSYQAGLIPETILEERLRLCHAIGEEITYNRHHYLDSREPEEMDKLVEAGITDDFTMGYADRAGYRLGTSRPVHWINPITKKIMNLTLHPLTIMECTLSNERYMNFEYEKALAYSRELIRQTAVMNGEVTLLWHNDSVAETAMLPRRISWQKKLYETLLEDLKA